MKNLGIASVLFSIIILLNACSVSQTAFVPDDLYDSYQKSVTTTSKKKQASYLNFEDDAQIIQEDDATFIQGADEVNFLNSRVLYQQGFNSGFNQGIFTSNPWNNWYANPFINFGMGFGNRWNSPLQSWRFNDPFFSGFPMGGNFGHFGGMGFGGFNSFGFSSPFGFYDPFFGFGGSGMFFGNRPVYNYYNGFGQNFNGGNNFQSNVTTPRDPAPRYNRGPRDGGSTNRYSGENYSNSPRGGTNVYNNQGNNQPRVNSNSNTYRAPAQAAPRRNSNVEFRPSAPQQSSGQNRTESYRAPSSNFSGGSYNSGGGGSSSGGSSRGPR